jgi:hypothetical protein
VQNVEIDGTAFFRDDLGAPANEIRFRNWRSGLVDRQGLTSASIGALMERVLHAT